MSDPFFSSIGEIQEVLRNPDGFLADGYWKRQKRHCKQRFWTIVFWLFILSVIYFILSRPKMVTHQQLVTETTPAIFTNAALSLQCLQQLSERPNDCGFAISTATDTEDFAVYCDREWGMLIAPKAHFKEEKTVSVSEVFDQCLCEQGPAPHLPYICPRERYAQLAFVTYVDDQLRFGMTRQISFESSLCYQHLLEKATNFSCADHLDCCAPPLHEL